MFGGFSGKILVTMIVLAVVAGVAAVIIRNSDSKTNQPDAGEAVSLVGEFEDQIKAQGVLDPERLTRYFVPDSNDSDRQQREKLLTVFQENSDLRYVLEAYNVLSSKSDDSRLTVVVREIRDYEDGTGKYGREFDRMFTLVLEGGRWRIEKYEQAVSGNTYTGGLSGSTKYGGFYP